MSGHERPWATGILAAALLFISIGCSGSTTITGYLEGGAGEGGADGGADAQASACASSIPATQGLSQACCPAWGADACGAGLFCGAFDGRTQTTCYPEHSRTDGESCTENVQCVSKRCDPTTKVCGEAPVVLPPPPPPEKMCPASCASDAECQNMCPPVSGGGINCCDPFAKVCFKSGAAACPSSG